VAAIACPGEETQRRIQQPIELPRRVTEAKEAPKASQPRTSIEIGAGDSL
jgi:hypothetical protein